MRVRRSFWAGALAAVLLLGAVDWHPAGEPPDSLALRAGEVYSPAAKHPHQPAHFEAADLALRPVCPVCLHHLQTSGAHLRVAVGLSLPAPAAVSMPDTGPLPSSGSRRQDAARGPPFFS